MRAALHLAVAGLVLASCGDGSSPGDDRAAQARDAALEAGLDRDVADFLGLAARGATATYQATFPGPTEGTTLVIANRPPDRRVDVIEDGEVTEIRMVLDGQAYECRPDTDGERIDDCRRTDAVVDPPGLFAPDTLEQLTSSLQERQDDFTFRVETSTVAGVDATCLVNELREGRERPELGDRGQLCVSPEGALVSVEQSGESLTATEYSTEIPEGTFVLPGPGDG